MVFRTLREHHHRSVGNYCTCSQWCIHGMEDFILREAKKSFFFVEEAFLGAENDQLGLVCGFKGR